MIKNDMLIHKIMIKIFYLTSVNSKRQDNLTYFNRIENKMSISFRFPVFYTNY